MSSCENGTNACWNCGEMCLDRHNNLCSQCDETVKDYMLSTLKTYVTLLVSSIMNAILRKNCNQGNCQTCNSNFGSRVNGVCIVCYNTYASARVVYYTNLSNALNKAISYLIPSMHQFLSDTLRDIEKKLIAHKVDANEEKTPINSSMNSVSQNTCTFCIYAVKEDGSELCKACRTIITETEYDDVKRALENYVHNMMHFHLLHVTLKGRCISCNKRDALYYGLCILCKTYCKFSQLKSCKLVEEAKTRAVLSLDDEQHVHFQDSLFESLEKQHALLCELDGFEHNASEKETADDTDTDDA